MTVPYIQKEQGGSVMRFNTGASLFLGNTALLFGSELPTVTASAGAVYFRSDGSASNIYVNTSTGVSGSVWKGASLFS